MSVFNMASALQHLGMGDPNRPDRNRVQRQAELDSMRSQITQAQPQNVGQGVSAVAQALNYRRLKGQQAKTPVGGPVAPGADPWSGMRQGGGALSSILNLFR